VPPVPLTGASVARLRAGLGLDVRAFADLLGVSLSTAYRWEGLPPSRPLRVDPMQQRLLAVIGSLRDRLGDRAFARLGAELGRRQAAGGPLAALHALLDARAG
jgi:hypothetical protein